MEVRDFTFPRCRYASPMLYGPPPPGFFRAGRPHFLVMEDHGMLKPLARTTAVLVAGLVAAASARAQVPSPPVVLPCRVPRADARQEAQVSLEVRVVTVPDQFFERIGVDFNVNTTTDKAAASPAAGVAVSSGGIYQRLHAGQFSVRPDRTPERVPATSPPRFARQIPVRCSSTINKSTRSWKGCRATRIPTSCRRRRSPSSMARWPTSIARINRSFVTSLEVVQRDGRPVVVPKTEE